VIGLTKTKTLTLLDAPEEDFLLPGDILVSPRAFYLVHSVTKKSSKRYPHQYRVSCTRLGADDEAIAQGKHLEICTATKAFLEMASV